MSFYLKLAFLIFANLLVKPIYIFGIEIQVLNFVGEEIYGQYISLLSLTIIFSTILDGGINHFHNLRISKNPNDLDQRFIPTLKVKLGLSWLYFFVVMLAGFVLAYNTQQLQILAIILINQIFISLFTFNRFTLSALQYFKLDSLASVLDKLLMIFIIGGFMYLDAQNFSIYKYIWGQTIAFLITIIITTFFVLYKNQYIQKLRYKVAWYEYKQILKSSIPYALLAVLIGIYTRSDAVMLERMLSDNGFQAGVYGAGFRLLEAISQFAMLISFWLVSVYAKLFEEKNIRKIKSLTFQIAGISFLGSIAIALVSWFWQMPIMEICYTEATKEYGLVFGWLMLSLPSKVLLYIIGTLLTAAEKIKLLNIIALVGAFFNLVLNFYLIPQYGAWAAAVTTLFTQSLVVGVQCVFAFRLLNKENQV